MPGALEEVAQHPPLWLRLSLGLVFTAAFIALAAAGWGSRAGLLAHSARRAACLVLVALAVVFAFAPVHMGRGRREDVRSRWIFLPFVVLSVLWAWLPPWCDRRELWIFGGDGVRWLGVGLLAAGGGLRVWPMFVLGRRFSGLVAIQEGHELVTGGIYGMVRHPSYLGGIVAMVGWALVFRSAAGLLLDAGALWLTAARIEAEERLLAAEFGARWAAYRARTWRLVPFIY